MATGEACQQARPLAARSPVLVTSDSKEIAPASTGACYM